MRALVGAVVVATAVATTGAVYAASGPVDEPPAEVTWSVDQASAGPPAVVAMAVPVSQEQGCAGGNVIDRPAGVTGLR